MKCLLISLLISLCANFCFGFTIHGTVTSTNGEALGYTNIYLKGTSKGTSANLEGQYQLNLPAGTYDIVFEHIGFKQVIQTVTVAKDMVLNITLQPVEYQIGDVVIHGGEDPAYAVIRKAIAKRKYFLAAVKDYSCDVYLKGLARVTKMPHSILGFKLNKSGQSHGSPGDEGVVYLSESQSRLFYEQPNKFHEIVYSSKVSGRAQGYTFNSAQDFYFNFYNSSIAIDNDVADRPFISPLSDEAFFFYKFHMLGAYKEGDHLVNKIEVTPKRANDPCFSGTISIIEDNWNISSLELYLYSKNGIRYIDTLKITQYFIPVKDDLWLPSQQRYDANGGALGIKGEGYYLGIFSNYQLNDLFGMEPVVTKIDSVKQPKKFVRKKKKEEKKIAHKIFTPEIIKIEDSANKRSTVYWDSIRPIPLNKLEATDYHRKDSIETLHESKAWRDSVDKLQRHFDWQKLLLDYTGYYYRNASKKFSIQFPGLNGFVHYNTVEGYNINIKFTLVKEFKKHRTIGFVPKFRYGVTNRQFNMMGTVAYLNNFVHDEYFRISGGRYVSQFSADQPQSELGNTLQTLFLRSNFMKIYDQYFLKLSYSRELTNGLDGSLSLSYAQRSPLENTSAASVFYKDIPFTPNGVDLPGITEHEGNISATDILLAELNLHFTFGRKYITTPNGRIRIDETNYPELFLFYKKAIPVDGFTTINYDFLEARLTGKIPMKLLGTMFYRFGGGFFPNHKVADYEDYKDFYGNFLNTDGTDLLGFYLIRYYRMSTDEYFSEAHIEHHFKGFFLNKIPGVRKLKLGEVLGFHFLYTPTRQQYFQIDAGIDNIFNIARVDFVTGFDGQTVRRFGIRVGISLGFLKLE